VKISTEGYDNFGKATMEFDSEKFEKDYEKKISAARKKSASKLKKDEDAYLEYMFEAIDDSTASSYFLSYVVNGKFDKADNLSNGDVITYKWNCDDDYALEIYGMKLKYSDIEYKVKGLEEAETFDPFEGIEVSFSGIAPNGTAEISGTPVAAAAAELHYKAEPSSNLSVGDKVTVSAYMYYVNDPIQYCAENYGMIPTATSKEYTVEGLDSYVSSISNISEKSLKEMQTQAEDVYKAKAANNWGDDETIIDFTYVGNYLLTTKNSSTWGSHNILYLVYKVIVNDTYSNSGKEYNKNKEFYWYISFSDLVYNDSGETTVDLTRYYTPNDRFTIDSGISSGWFSTKQWYYYGYETIDALYKVAVTCNIESYNHEDNIDESLITVNEPEKAEEIGEDGIVFPNSSDEIIDESKAKELSDDALRLAINEIYARHGYIFKDEDLLEYYRQYDWYEETVTPDKFSIDMFNDTEQQNISMLQKERDGR
jgi:hypothetical protein